MRKRIRTPPDIVEATKPYREAARPKECFMLNGSLAGGPCWVEEPFQAISTSQSPRCATCGGAIRTIHPIRSFSLKLRR